MPRARIITRSAEISREIVELLRARGFEIEIADPEAEVSQAVDLEIKLEEYTPEEALDRAELMPESADLCAFVAPGALAGEPVVAIPLLPGMADRSELTLRRLQYLQQASGSASVEEGNASLHAMSEDDVEPELNPVREPSAHVSDVVADTAPAWEALPVASWLASICVAFSALFGEVKSLWALARQRAAFSSLPSQRYRACTVSDAAFWKVATVIAALAVSALLVGASARWSPLPANTARSQESQRVPLEAALGNSGLASPARTPGKRGRRSRPAYHNAASLVADDVVIYYHKKPVPTFPPPLAKPDGIKRYSDLD
jgi:hypothetical protein